MFTKRLYCFLFAFLLVAYNSCCCFATMALPGEVSGGGGGVLPPVNLELGEFAQHVYDNMEASFRRGERLAFNFARCLVDDDACLLCPNENGRHNFIKQHTQVDGETGDYYICEYCGKSAGEVLEEAESEYVASLPAQTVTSEGGFVWHPSLSDVVSITFNFENHKREGDVGFRNFVFSPDNDIAYENILKIFADDDNSRLCITSNQSTYDRKSLSISQLKFAVPVSGVYSLQTGPCFNGIFMEFDDNNQHASSKSWTAVNDIACYVSPLVINLNINLAYWKYYEKCDGFIFLPSFSCVPQNPFNVSSSNDNDTYNIGTRAASITGNYGIVNNNGIVSQIESQSIVNEGQHTVYNPVTNETENFTDWDYDYSTRTYNLTNENGDTTTVTYGDEYVTYSSGGNTTNIYYIINSGESGEGGNSGGGDTPANPPHVHQYSSVDTITPTCTRSGVRTFTCSGCGASYTENIPATGHAWEVQSQLMNTYDPETGEQTQQGYTVYECSVCGQQYRSDDESLPPGVIGEDLQLQEASDNVLQLLPRLKPMYEGYLGLLSDVFPYLPSEIMDLIYFGIAACVFVGIWKAVRG